MLWRMRIDSSAGTTWVGLLAVAAGTVTIALAGCGGGVDGRVPFDASPSVSRDGSVVFVRGALLPGGVLTDYSRVFVARGTADPERVT